MYERAKFNFLLISLHTFFTIFYAQIRFLIAAYPNLLIMKFLLLLFEAEGLEISLVNKLYEFS